MEHEVISRKNTNRSYRNVRSLAGPRLSRGVCLGKHRPLFLPKTPAHRLRCHWHVKLIVLLSEGVISALSCLHPPLLVDPFKFLLAYLVEEAMDVHDVLMAKGSLRCFKVSGDRQSAIGNRWLREAGFVGGGEGG